MGETRKASAFLLYPMTSTLEALPSNLSVKLRKPALNLSLANEPVHRHSKSAHEAIINYDEYKNLQD
jgi:hypothetical protein